MKQSITKVTGLQVGYTTEWVVLDSGEWRVLTDDEQLLVDVEYTVKELTNTKSKKQTEIRNSFNAELELPVIINGISYSGGFDSAIKLDAAKRLVEALGATEVTFYDVGNVGHILNLVDAQSVITAIAIDYQTKFGIKQTKMVAVDNATTIQEVEAV